MKFLCVSIISIFLLGCSSTKYCRDFGIVYRYSQLVGSDYPDVEELDHLIILTDSIIYEKNMKFEVIRCQRQKDKYVWVTGNRTFELHENNPDLFVFSTQVDRLIYKKQNINRKLLYRILVKKRVALEGYGFN